MSIRIISGFLQGRRIAGPASDETRPTTDILRSSVFSALDSRYTIEGARVLDLFCGTGSFGIECISRGAAMSTFVDASASVCSDLRKTLQLFSIEDRTDVVADDVIHFLNADRKLYDVVFADPPYARKMCNAIASAVDSLHLLADGGLLIVEHADTEVLLSRPTLHEVWRKRHGDSVVEMYSKAGAET